MSLTRWKIECMILTIMAALSLFILVRNVQIKKINKTPSNNFVFHSQKLQIMYDPFKNLLTIGNACKYI